MLEGTPEGVDGGLLLKTIEKYAQWIGFMGKVIQIKQKSLLQCHLFIEMSNVDVATITELFVEDTRCRR